MGAVVAQLLLRRLRARRAGVDRQGPGRPVAAGGERQAVRLQLDRDAAARGARAGSRRSRCSTTWCAGSSAGPPGWARRPRWRSCRSRVLTARSDTMDSVMMAARRGGRVAGGPRRADAPRVAARRRRRGDGARVQRQAVRGARRRCRRSRCWPCSAGDLSWRRRAAAMAGRAAAFVVVGGAWMTIASLTTAGRPAVADRVDQRQRLERRLRLQRRGPAAQDGVRGRAQARPAGPAALLLDHGPRLRRPGRRDAPRRPGLRRHRPGRRGGRAPGAPAPGGRRYRLPGPMADRGRRSAEQDAALRAALPRGGRPGHRGHAGSRRGLAGRPGAQRAHRGARPRGGRSHRRGGGERDGRPAELGDDRRAGGSGRHARPAP